MVIHVGTEDMDEELEDSLSINPAAIKTLQRSPKFRSLFNQLGLGLMLGRQQLKLLST